MADMEVREKRKELRSQRDSSVLWHLTHKSPVPTLLGEEQEEHYVRLHSHLCY